MTKRTHEQLKKMVLSRPGVRKEYDALEEEFRLLSVLIEARKSAGKTQEQIAKSMKTTTSVVGRLETAGGKLKHSPTWETLCKYAQALGGHLVVKFVCHAKVKTRRKSSHSSFRRLGNKTENIVHVNKKHKLEKHGERS